MSEQAHRVQNTNGVKSNRNVVKEDYVKRHARSKVKGINDPRDVEIQIRLVHPHKSVITKTIQMYRLEAEKEKWSKEGWELFITN